MSDVEHLSASEQRLRRLNQARRALLREGQRCATVDCPNAWTHVVATDVSGSLLHARFCTPCTRAVMADDDQHGRSVTPPLTEED